MRETTLDAPAPTDWGEGLVAVRDGEPIDVSVRLESVHEGILASGTVSTEYAGECGRCLQPITAPLEVEFQELFAYPGDEANDFEVQDDRLDLEELVRDVLVLALPFQPVCDQECPGLDPSTGERLASVPDADEHESLDPRWAALAGLVDDSAADTNKSAPQT